MSRVEDSLRISVSDLESIGARWALIGGLAVSIRFEPRLTRDVDFTVAVGSDREAESLVRELISRGYQTVAVLEQTAVGRLATVRLRPPGGNVELAVVDLLFASSGIEAEIVRDAEILEIPPGIRVPVARTGHLIALKVLAKDDRRRPQDFDDLKGLLTKASPAELERAKTSLDLIRDRGFSRGKDLRAELEAFLRPGA